MVIFRIDTDLLCNTITATYNKFSSNIFKFYIKDTNHFLKKPKELGQFQEGTILCTIDVVGLYPNIPLDEGLAFLKYFLDSKVVKQATARSFIEFVELVLKNTIFEFFS